MTLIRLDGPGTPYSRQLRDTVDTGWNVQQKLDRLYRTVEAADPATNGYGVIEELFGLPEGTGQTVYNLITGARSAVNEYNFNALLDFLA